MLFAAARLDHVNQLIAPNLEAGNWVISDRFSDSTRAYQGLTGGVDPKLIDAIEELALNGYVPELTIVMDMDPKLAFERVAQRAIETGIPISSDRFERENLKWHQQLRQSFLKIADDNPSRCHVVQADGDEQQIANEIWSIFQKSFSELTKKTSR